MTRPFKIRHALICLALLGLAGTANAATVQTQAITCAGAVANTAYASCAPILVTAQNSSTPLIWCSSGTTTGALLAACSSKVWYRMGSLQSYSWVYTQAGWHRWSDVILVPVGGSPAPPNAPPPPTATVPATLSWTAPTQNTDGSPAVITGYRIEYGQIDFANSVTTTARSYNFTLTVGSWQFRVIALSGAVESVPSAVAHLTVVTPPPPAVWIVAATGSVYEAVLPASGSGFVRGNQDGTIAAGKLCGGEAFTIAGASYRTVQNVDATLASPTYQTRTHVAICVRQ